MDLGEILIKLESFPFILRRYVRKDRLQNGTVFVQAPTCEMHVDLNLYNYYIIPTPHHTQNNTHPP